MTGNQIQKSNLQVIKKHLTGDAAIGVFRDCLPSAMGSQAEQVAKRYGLQIYAAVLQTPKLQNCTVQSLIREACKMASLDLDIDARGLAYLVPYGTEAQAQIGYKGLMELAYRSGKVKSINAEVIHKSERDSIVVSRIDGCISINHPWDWQAPSGGIIAAYATAHIDGCDPMTCLLRIEEIEAYRARSKQPKGFGWTDNYAAMCKKTAIRRLSTMLPKSIVSEFSRAVANDEAKDFATARAKAETSIDTAAGSEIIEAAFETNPAPEANNDEPDWMSEE